MYFTRGLVVLSGNFEQVREGFWVMLSNGLVWLDALADKSNRIQKIIYLPNIKSNMKRPESKLFKQVRAGLSAFGVGDEYICELCIMLKHNLL